MKKAVGGIVAGLVLAGLVACSNYNSSSNRTQTRRSGLTFRAFISNPTHPGFGGIGTPAIEIVDASKDLISPFLVALSSLGSSVSGAGPMVLSPKRDFTVLLSPPDNRLAVINNASESVNSTITLPGLTQSFLVWTDNTTGFVALPNVGTSGVSPGEVVRINLSNGTTTATIPIQGARHLVASPNGGRILVLSDNANLVTVLDPSLINSGNPLTPVQNPAGCVADLDQANACVFDRPVAAVFSADGSKAYVLNCGRECGGQSFSNTVCAQQFCGSVTVLDMGTTQAAPPVPLPDAGATSGMLVNGTLYVAGSAPAVQTGQNTCTGLTTAAVTCGQLTSIDVASMTMTGSALISDGYHDHIEMGANQQLFIGARNCTNINIAGGEVRGCLSIADTSASISNSGIVMPPDNGDVTGIAPIPPRPASGQISSSVVYVCEGGKFRIYDTSIDKSTGKPKNKLEALTISPGVVGQAVDVKMIDP